jgi:hypothetical protein
MVHHELSGAVVQTRKFPVELFELQRGCNLLARKAGASIPGPLSLTSTLEVKRRVEGRLVEPSCKSTRVLDAIELPANLKKYFLASVLGVLGMAKDLVAEGVDGVLMPLQEPRQRGPPRPLLILQEDVIGVAHAATTSIG